MPRLRRTQRFQRKWSPAAGITIHHRSFGTLQTRRARHATQKRRRLDPGQGPMIKHMVVELSLLSWSLHQVQLLLFLSVLEHPKRCPALISRVRDPSRVLFLIIIMAQLRLLQFRYFLNDCIVLKQNQIWAASLTISRRHCLGAGQFYIMIDCF